MTIWAYYPGLAGPFLFDDWANLPALGEYGKINHWQAFWRYLTSGTADPTGRPIALLTFLIDANDWPADPQHFKYTNLMIHLLNGLLLLWLLLRLGTAISLPSHQNIGAAILATNLWMLHPLFVSTTLYVIQREAMLVATWVLIGLHSYLYGRCHLSQSSWRGIIWMTFGITIGTLLGVLSKANGILLPLFAWLMDSILIKPKFPLPQSSIWRWWLRIFVILPSILLLGWLFQQGINTFTSDLPNRPFTGIERLLTEPRVLVNYLLLLFFPRPYTSGLFNDAYPISSHLWQPWTTLLAIVLLSTLPVICWVKRKKWPVFSFSLLFFLAGHLLESTVIPLELYFEHRNYVPALFLFWPIALGLFTSKTLSSPVRTCLIIGCIIILATFTRTRSTIWGDGAYQALTWARINPLSSRAQTQAALHEMKSGMYEAAADRLTKALRQHPNSVQIALNLLSARCGIGKVTRKDLDQAAYALSHAQVGKEILFNWMLDVVQHYSATYCQGLDHLALERLLQATEINPAATEKGWQQNIFHLRGILALQQSHPQRAAEYFKQAIKIDPYAGIILREAAIMGSHSCPELGLEILTMSRRYLKPSPETSLGMARIHEWLLKKGSYWEREYRHLYHTLTNDIKAYHDPMCPQINTISNDN